MRRIQGRLKLKLLSEEASRLAKDKSFNEEALR